MTSADLAWAAGFFDGEGCVHISRLTHPRYGSRHALKISVAQKRHKLLRAFQQILGIEGSIEDYEKGNCAHLIYGGMKAAAVLELLLPYLRGKKEQAEIAIGFQRDMQAGGGHGRNTPLSGQELSARQWAYEKLRELKR